MSFKNLTEVTGPDSGPSRCDGHRTRLAVLGWLTLGVVACGPQESAPAGDPSESTTPVPSQLDALRALGYAGVSQESYAAAESGVVLFRPAKVDPGYVLYSVDRRCAAFLMDMSGKIVKRWERSGDLAWPSVHLLPNGDLLAIGQDDFVHNQGTLSERRYIVRLSWEGEELWRSDINAHHDLEVTPDGQLASLSFTRSTGTSLTSPGVILREDTVRLLDLKTGAGLEERSIKDVLLSRTDLFQLKEVRPVETPEVRFVDLFHTNSLEFTRARDLPNSHPLYEVGNVLVSSRHQSVIFLFNWQSGELLWQWGTGELMGPHDATLLENGNVMVFDNGLGRGWSRIVELNPVSGQIAWSFKDTPPEGFYSASRGSSQRLPNGNTLIAESDRGRAFEVTARGRRVWAWINPERTADGKVSAIMRMKRLPTGYVEAILEGRGRHK